MKILLKVIKRVIIGCFILYVYNYFAVKYSLIIPINIITVPIVSIFDIVGLIGLIIFKFII